MPQFDIEGRVRSYPWADGGPARRLRSFSERFPRSRHGLCRGDRSVGGLGARGPTPWGLGRSERCLREPTAEDSANRRGLHPFGRSRRTLRRAIGLGEPFRWVPDGVAVTCTDPSR
ncbi:MAG: hypothetical protein N2109_10570 [Fimbriimonadales bacterium]|nr:hypothetical protein [Fimbriimonadales bacterium]